MMSLAIVGSKSVNAQSIETMTGRQQIKVDGVANAIAINYDTNKIYVYNPKNGTVSVIDSTLDGIAKNIPVGAPSLPYLSKNQSHPIAVDDPSSKIYVVNARSGDVYPIDATNDTVKKPIKVGKSPLSLAVDIKSYMPESKIYVLHQNGSVSVIDSSNYTEKAHNIRVGEDPTDIQFSSDSNSIYVANKDSVSVIEPENDTVKAPPIKVGKGPHSILIAELNVFPRKVTFFSPTPAYRIIDNRYIYKGHYLPKIYVTNYSSNTVSVIDGSTDTNIKNISVGVGPFSMTLAGNNKLYVADRKHNVSVINIITDKDVQNISLGFTPSGIAGDYKSHKIYVADSNSSAASVIDSSNNCDKCDKKELHDIVIGQTEFVADQTNMIYDKQKDMIYVVNSGSHTVSVINGSSSKVAAGVTFNSSPANAGTILCNKKEIPTNIYRYLDVGTICIAQPNKDFEFSSWVENLNRNSTLPLNSSTICNTPLDSFLCNLSFRPKNDPSATFNVTRYGTFTANFKALPPTVPPEYLFLIISVIVTTIIGWSIPSIFGWFKARSQLKHLEECMNQIGKLDRNEIEDKIKGYYVHGKLSEDHRQYLKDSISEYYESMDESKGMAG